MSSEQRRNIAYPSYQLRPGSEQLRPGSEQLRPGSEVAASLVPNRTGGSTPPTSSSTTTAPTYQPPANAIPVNISVTASDSSDNYARYWSFFIDGQLLQQSVHTQGDTMTSVAPVAPGTHQFSFLVSQDGDSSYGTYEGTAVIGGQNVPFSGVDANHSFTANFTVGSSGATSPPTTSPSTTPPVAPTPFSILGLSTGASVAVIGAILIAAVLGIVMLAFPKPRRVGAGTAR